MAQDQTQEQGQQARQAATALQQMLDWDNRKFGDWYDADMKMFDKWDKNHDGELQADEFKEWMKDLCAMDESTATKVFEAWDIDGGGTVGPYEYCSIMAIMHVQESLIEKEAEMAAMDKQVRDLFCCGITCFLLSIEYGAKCCCCTCGLSCCPMYCQLQYMTNQMAYKIEHAKEIEEQYNKDLDTAKKAAITDTLSKGPQDALKLAVRDSQKLEKADVNTPLLSKA